MLTVPVKNACCVTEYLSEFDLVKVIWLFLLAEARTLVSTSVSTKLVTKKVRERFCVTKCCKRSEFSLSVHISYNILSNIYFYVIYMRFLRFLKGNPSIAFSNRLGVF